MSKNPMKRMPPFNKTVATSFYYKNEEA